jgi:sodium-dependent dicarboxylate transporter 2/3/5
MIDMVTKVSPPGYDLAKGCTTIVETVNKKLRPTAFEASRQGKTVVGKKSLMDEKEVARNAKIMLAILFLAAFLWGSEALPLGATDIMVGVMIYLFAILPINDISQAYMKDAVFFIFGILAVAVPGFYPNMPWWPS